MKVKIILSLIILTILAQSALASPANNTYDDHGISFQIPSNWSVVKDQNDINDSKIIISDNSSAIRIDIINKDYLLTFPGHDEYQSREFNAYKTFINPQKSFCFQGTGLPISSNKGLTAGMSCDESNGFVEWVLLWPIPLGKFIGIHALLNTFYSTTRINWGMRTKYYEEYIYMPDPLFDLLASINFFQKPQMIMKRRITCEGIKELDSLSALNGRKSNSSISAVNLV